MLHPFLLPTAQPNKDLKAVKDFKVALRHAQHAAIFECFRAFNRKGGAIVPLQAGGHMYFSRACILAIFADHPAARKCSLTGSACPVCYTPETKMSLVEQEPRHALMRTEANMTRRKRVFTLMSERPEAGAHDLAIKRAKKIGVNLDLPNAWYDGDAGEEEKVYGPSLGKDNIFQILPQPNLHAMDEGLVQKTNLGVVQAMIKEAKSAQNIPATEVRDDMTLHVHHDVHFTCCYERYDVHFKC
jgi:hypothetical protein